MPLKFAKKASSSPSSAQEESSATTKFASSSTKSTSKPSGSLGWMKTGQAAKDAVAKEEAKAEMQAASAGKLWRFWMPPEEERQVTFLDGKLDDDGMLDILMFYEHAVKINGRFENFICTSDAENGYCPICEKGEAKANLVGVMTVIDHTPHKIQSGPNAGKIIKNSKKLYVAKKQTLKMLTKKAQKHKGLVGVTFDITRGDDKTAGVGSSWDFVSKMDEAELREKYGLSESDVQVADYGSELTYRTPQELIELGIGKAPGGIGYEKGVTDKNKLKDEL